MHAMQYSAIAVLFATLVSYLPFFSSFDSFVDMFLRQIPFGVCVGCTPYRLGSFPFKFIFSVRAIPDLITNAVTNATRDAKPQI